MAGRRVTGAGALILDVEGIFSWRRAMPCTRGYLDVPVTGARVAVSAIRVDEALRGGSRDAAVHRVLATVVVISVTEAIARRAGELLGATCLSGHRCAIDAVVAATALEMERPVVLLTSDPDDLNKLVEEPERPKAQRIVVVRV